MAVNQAQKSQLVQDYQRGQGDTGSPEVQIALLTARISDLTEHFKTHVQARGCLRRAHRSGLCRCGRFPAVLSGPEHPIVADWRHDVADWKAYSLQGGYGREGYLLCQKHVNAKGGVLGRNIEFVIYDDQSDESTAARL